MNRIIFVIAFLVIGSIAQAQQMPAAPDDSPPVKYRGGVAFGEGSFEPGCTVNIRAQADPGFEFDHWSGDDVADPGQAETSIVLDSHKKIRPVFKRIWNVIGTTKPNEAGQVQGSGLYPVGDKVTLTVQPAEGQTFKHWEGDQVQGLTDLQVTIEVTGNHDLVAVFENQDQDQQQQQQQNQQQEQEQNEEDKQDQQDQKDKQKEQEKQEEKDKQDQQQQDQEKQEEEKKDQPSQSQEQQKSQPGQMTREEARQLLESLKDEEKKLPLILLEENRKKQSDDETKDW